MSGDRAEIVRRLRAITPSVPGLASEAADTIERQRGVIADLLAALTELFGTCKNEMVSRGLPIEWQDDCAMARAGRAIATHQDKAHMNDADFLHALGDDAMKWAAAFCERLPNSNPGVDVMLGWFANAIEHSRDIRTGRIHNGDHMQFLLDRGRSAE